MPDSTGGGLGQFHVPVLVEEVKSHFRPALQYGGLLIDCTLGGGGHSEALLLAFPRTRLLGLDQDPQAIESAAKRLSRFGSRVTIRAGNFQNLIDLTARPADIGPEVNPDEQVKGVLYDLGASSFQLDRPERGFQLRSDARLDMRMDLSSSKTAELVVNSYSERDLARLIRTYGEERFAGRIAKAVIRRREASPIQSTSELAEIVKAAIPAAARRRGPHPARRTFQALRIEVNDELGALKRSLPQALELLSPQGRIAAISYHSLEDRIVKRFFVLEARGCVCPPDLPVCVCGKGARLRILNKRPVRPSDEEIAANPRSDSARLRVAERLGEAA